MRTIWQNASIEMEFHMWNVIPCRLKCKIGFLKAIMIFRQMKLQGIKPNSETFSNVFLAFIEMEALKLSMDIHQDIMESIFEGSNVVTMYALIDMSENVDECQWHRSF